jgi:uncharacterized repeat protein (TIGR01451 family)
MFTQSKTTDAASYIVGQPITYTITVTNTGAGPGMATVADLVPSNVGSVAVTCASTGTGTCGTTGSSGNTVTGSVALGPGEVATYTVTGVVTAAGSVTNTATITPTTPGCTTQCGGGIASTPPTIAGENPLFTQTKTADQTSYIVGQPITYTITVTNTGGGPGTATIADTVPATVGSVAVTCAATGAGTCTTAGSTANTVAGSVSLPPAAVATYTVTGVVTAANLLTNTATVSPTTPGCSTACGGGNAVTPPISAVGNPHFTQTKTADEASYIVGQPIVYTVTVTNDGSGPGTASVSDPVPATVGSFSATCAVPSPSACNTTGTTGTTVTGSVDLAAGASAIYTITGVVVATGSVADTATVAPSTPGCSTQCGGGPATTGPLVATANPLFTQTKTADAASYIVGQPITYTITVTNAGAGPGKATVADTVPPAVTVAAVSCAVTGSNTCDTAGSSGNTVAGAASLVPNGTATFTVSGTVTSAGNATNIATITPTTVGCTSQCGGGQASTPPLPVGNDPVFTQTKTTDATSYIIGQPITYAITVTNIGLAAGTATASDTVPSTVGSVAVTCAATGTGTCDTTGSAGNTVAGAVSLGPNEVATFRVTGVVTGVGDVANAATITPTTPGCTSQCGGGTATTPPTPARGNPVFMQTKVADKSSYIVGEPITYTITITNIGFGPGTASLADTVPVPVTSVTVQCSANPPSGCGTAGTSGNDVTGQVLLGPGESAVFTVLGTVTNAGDLTNTAVITPTTPGCSTQCGGGDATTPPTSAGNGPMFTQAKSADLASYIVGQPITYTITVTNAGAGPGTATIADPVPTTVRSIQVTCSATGTGTCNTAGSGGNTVAGTASLGPKEVAIYIVTGVVTGAGSVANTATITPTTPGCSTQCGGGDASTAPTTAVGNPVFTQIKTADTSSYILGQPITYTITITNTGTGPGTATVADSVPSTVGSVAVTCTATDGGTCNTTGTTGNAVAGAVNLPAGQRATYIVTGQVTGVGNVANTATVTPTTPGCQPVANDQCGGGPAPTGPLASSGNPLFTQTKTADASSYIVGQPITYTITVTNAGTGPGTAAVADTVPATVNVTSVRCSVAGTDTCNTTGSVGNAVVGAVALGPGGVATYTIAGSVTRAGNATNIATITPTNSGCTIQCGGGNASTPTLPVGNDPVFTQTKTTDAASYIVGQPITYTITVTNIGLAAGTATLFDPVPATVGSVAVTCTVTATGNCDTSGSTGNTVAGSMSLGPNEVATYTITGVVIGAGSVANTATLTPTTPGCQPAPNDQCGGGDPSTPPTPLWGLRCFPRQRRPTRPRTLSGNRSRTRSR